MNRSIDDTNPVSTGVYGSVTNACRHIVSMGKAHAGHARQLAGVARPPPTRPSPAVIGPAVVCDAPCTVRRHIDAGHLDALVNVDPTSLRRDRVSPHHRVVPRERARRVHEAPDDRELSAAR